MEISKISKVFSVQISIIVLILVSAIMYSKEDIFKFFEYYQAMQERELEVTKKETQLAFSTNQNEFFQGLLAKYLNEHSGIDYGRQKQCDEEYMQKYRKAEAALKAVEGAAKAANQHDQYQVFFQSQRAGMMHISC